MALSEAVDRPDDATILEIDRVLHAFRLHHPDAPDRMIHQAYELAVRLHADQFRKSGEPYITHPIIVAHLLAEYGMDAETLAAAILHDTVEDTELTIEGVREQFGEVVSDLIDGVTKLDRIRFDTQEQAQAASIRKLVIAMARDIRVLLIKLADRLHNIRTLYALPEEKQRRIATETIEIYAPLAHRLGVQEIKHEMEERCFHILYPRRSAELEDQVQRRAPEREAFLEKTIAEVTGALSEAGIEAEVTGRPKHIYSIYRKMMNSGLAFEEIHDLLGIRIITKDVRDCYAVLGTVHTMWTPIHGRFKDYIAMPKYNLYQSIHTTVVGPARKALEIQIRTREMHERAEFGVAAHWRYKEGAGESDIPLVADIRYLQEEYDDPSEFLANLKLDLYRDEAFVLTPKGDVVTLPRGATPIDFAYSIHTEVGHRCIGAKVNSRLVPLATPLESGDIVEIIRSRAPDAGPSWDWLEFTKTSRAASKIRQWFSKERREQALHDGREQVMRLLRKEGLGLSASRREKVFDEVAEALGYLGSDAMFVAAGEGHVNAATLVGRVVRVVRPVDETDEDLLSPPRHVRRKRPSLGVIVEGMDDMLVRIARCCAPVPGDSIVGFVTVGRGVSVHRADCANIGALRDQEERMIEVDWAPDRIGSFLVWIQVEALDRPRLLRDVTSVLSDVGADIQASSSATGRDRVAVLRYEIELSDPELLDAVIAQLRGVEGVFDAYRLVPQQPAD